MRPSTCDKCGRQVLLSPGAINYLCKNRECPYGLNIPYGYSYDRLLLRLTFAMTLFTFIVMATFFLSGLFGVAQ